MAEARPVTDYRVTVLKRLVFTVQAASDDEARALAIVTATGAGGRRTRAAVRCEGRTVTVETCEAAPVAGRTVAVETCETAGPPEPGE